MVCWVVGSIPHGGPTEVFLVPIGAARLVKQRPWYVLSCLWDGAYKRTLAANLKKVSHIVSSLAEWSFIIMSNVI